MDDFYTPDSPWGSEAEFDARLAALRRSRAYVAQRLDALQRETAAARMTWLLCDDLVHDLIDLDGHAETAALVADCERLRLLYVALLADLVAFTKEHVFLPDSTTDYVA